MLQDNSNFLSVKNGMQMVIALLQDLDAQVKIQKEDGVLVKDLTQLSLKVWQITNLSVFH